MDNKECWNKYNRSLSNRERYRIWLQGKRVGNVKQG